MKKLFSLALCFVLIFSTLTFVNINASAATSGYYTYTVSNSKATITDCDESISGSITIPSTLGGYPVTSIGSYAFYSCDSLTSVTIGNSVTSIGSSAFEYCDSLTSITVDSSNQNYSSADGVLFNKAKTTLIKYPEGKTATSYTIPNSVTSIESRAFYSCDSLTSVTIGNSVTSIGYYAFYWCDSLTSVTIPNSVTSIGSNAFSWCESLTSVTIPNSVTSIGSYAFSYCDSLTSVTIPNSVTSIGDDAFYSCDSLTSVTIPNSVTSIGDGAFEYCDSLTSITVDSSNQNYSSANGVLFNKTKTTLIKYPEGKTANSYTIPNSVTSIDSSAFRFCYSLTSVTIPNSVTSIGSYAFSWCESLTSVTIPDSVTSIGSNAFYSCDSLTSVTVDSSNQNYSSANGVLFNEAKTTLIKYPEGKTATSYTIPNSVTSIGSYAFYSCDSLTSVTIPNSVTNIGSHAFYSCDSLTSVTIPNSVTSIGDYAFYWCDSLADVYYAGSEDDWNDITIGSGNTYLTDATIHYNSSGSSSTTQSNTLTVNSTNSAVISTGGQVKYFYFTPSTTGTYVIYSTGSVDTMVYLYNSSGSQLTSNDDGGDDRNFRLSYSLTAGTTYKYGVRYYNSSTTGTISFKFGGVYTLTYNTNGGSSTPSSQSCDYGKSVTVTSSTPTRSGYTFLGWSTSSTATTASYTSGNTISLSSNTTLYAVWKKITYTLTYNANGGSGAPSSQTGATSYTISSTVPTRSGYTFLGWSTSSSATTASYTSGNTISLSSNTTLYAVWKKITYTLTYNANGGSGAPSSQTGATSYTISSTVPTRSGYTFLGWSTSSTATTASYTSGSTISLSSNTTLYAVWKQGSTLTVNSTNSAVISTGGQVKYYYFTPSTTGTYVIYSTGSVDTYVTLYNSSGSQLTYDDQSGGNGNFRLSYNLTAGNTYKYGVKYYSSSRTGTISFKFGGVYTLTYNTNGGSSAPYSQSCDYGKSVTVTSSTPTRNGYTFLGWSTSSSATSASYTSGNSISLTANTTLYAVWKKITCTLTYNANGGSSAPSSQSCDYGKSVTVTSSTPTRSGYTFLGWSTYSDDDYADYESGNSIYLYSDKTLYAVWRKNPVLTYDANGGTGVPSSQSVAYYSYVYISSTEPTRSGYTFLGWSESRGDSYADYESGDSIYLYSDKTLYAVWRKNPILTYNANGGTGAPSSQTYAYGDMVYISSTEPTRSGYTFLGWSTSSYDSYADYESGDSIYLYSDETLYAVWERSYTLTYDANGGTGAPSSQTYAYGDKVYISSTEPTKSGCEFLGWSEYSGESYADYESGEYTYLYNDVTLYAIWHQHYYEQEIIITATCLREGTAVYTCYCGDEYSKTIPKSAHNVVIDKAVAATCLRSGKTEGSHCSVCKVVIKAQQDIKIKEHFLDYHDQAPTYFENGFRKGVCVSCELPLENTSINKLVLKVPKFKLLKGKKQFKLKYTKVADATGFQVQYKTGKGKWKIKNFNTKKTATKLIKKLKKGTYQVQIRAMIVKGKQKAYSAWSKIKKVKVK